MNRRGVPDARDVDVAAAFRASMSGVGGFCCGPAVLIPPSEAATATHAYFKAMLVVLAVRVAQLAQVRPGR